MAVDPQARNARLAELIARVALADQRAFAELYQQTSSHLFGVALRIVRERGIAEELLQEAYVNVWHHAGSYAAERAVVHLANAESVSEPSRRYLNRLSDLLFVMARALNAAAGRPDVLWQKGRLGGAGKG